MALLPARVFVDEAYPRLEAFDEPSYVRALQLLVEMDLIEYQETWGDCVPRSRVQGISLPESPQVAIFLPSQPLAEGDICDDEDIGGVALQRLVGNVEGIQHVVTAIAHQGWTSGIDVRILTIDPVVALAALHTSLQQVYAVEDMAITFFL